MSQELQPLGFATVSPTAKLTAGVALQPAETAVNTGVAESAHGHHGPMPDRPTCLRSPAESEEVSYQEYLLAPLLWTRSVPEKVYRWMTYLSAFSPDLPTCSTADYVELRQSILVDPHANHSSTSAPLAEKQPASDHPLSQADESQWSRFFQLEEVRATINKDVTRTFPEDDFFQLADTQQSLAAILTVHSMHHRIPYRQGMHELCAVLYWLVYQERSDSQSVDDREALTYHLYEALMHLQSYLFERDHAVKLSHRFMHVFLRAIDPELYSHLTNLQLEPHLFGIRWLRLLFAREFSLPMVADVWDGLFCLLRSHPNVWHDHLCYMAVSVILASRHTMMQADYAQVMSAAMHYTSPLTGSDVVLQAVQFRYRFAPVVFDFDQRFKTAGGGATSPRPQPAAAAAGSRRAAKPRPIRDAGLPTNMPSAVGSAPGSPLGSWSNLSSQPSSPPGPGLNALPAAVAAPAVKAARGAIRALSAVLAVGERVKADELKTFAAGESTSTGRTSGGGPVADPLGAGTGVTVLGDPLGAGRRAA
ncbi:rab-GTPase-TBC domain-domain-containing protein [Catenaria anguillulae PL171]|uniref:Rab-GTPase-TBC domain-domain-containing protein n=1 Tax=Catenaria anguillulae PL171 TaxID=765915 RepID=A0A1Y2HHH2_9FUNG|nr:rab-GTPase-TBC domain-domain-containing protein [Catenaria anguillulae PL171]